MTSEADRRIVVSALSKRFGSVVAVDQLSFAVEPGTVTGFLGPNGAGKTTTLRMILGLVRPDSGRATISGVPYAELRAPLALVGSVLDTAGFHPARSARNHLRVICTATGLPHRRADEVLDTVGLAAARDRAVRGFSLGMRQRLALAQALLGDPAVLVLDEPANGLDPEGIAWMRQLLRHLADGGRTVLVSSHVLSEMQQLVDHVVIINKGRLVRQGTLAELTSEQAAVLVRTPDADELTAAVARSGGGAHRSEDGLVRVTGLDAAEVGRLAAANGLELHELVRETSGLEAVFFALTTADRGQDA